MVSNVRQKTSWYDCAKTKIGMNCYLLDFITKYFNWCPNWALLLGLVSNAIPNIIFEHLLDRHVEVDDPTTQIWKDLKHLNNNVTFWFDVELYWFSS